jgi:sugar diacid utilization regulator
MPDKQGGLSEYSAALLSALAEESGALSKIIGIGYSRLGNPILVTDKSWKAIAVTDGADAPDDPGWHAFFTDGILPPELVTSGLRDNLAQRIEQSTAPFRWQSADMTYPRIFRRIVIGDKTAAAVSVLEINRPFLSEDTPALELLCAAIAAELQKNQFRQYTRGMLYENFLWNLLEGRLTDPKTIEERVRILNLGMKKNIYVFVFDLREYDSQQYSLTYMRDVLEKMISGGQALVYDDKIVITASFTRARDIFKTELRNLSVFLKKYNIRCGISRRCTEPSQLRFYYEQALDAMRVGTHLDFDRYIYPYGEYAVYHIAEVCGEAGGAARFCHPALETLLAHDREYDTAFTDSLYAYIRHFKNVTAAAGALHLHRNTMVYHLRRIEEITDISLTDYNVLQLIELSFRMLEYDKKIERREKWDDVPGDEK